MIPQVTVDEVRAAFGFPPELAADSLVAEAIAWARERLTLLVNPEPDPQVWAPRLALAARLMAGAQVLRLTAAAAAAGPRHLVLAGQRASTDPAGSATLASAIDDAARALIAPLCPPPSPMALLTDPRPLAGSNC